MQVVTSENIQQLIETGKVDEYKRPETPKAAETKEEPKVEDPKDKEEKNAEGLDKQSETVDKGDKAAAKAEADDDEDLSEKVRKKIGAKHRAMKEAEEFAEQQYNERKAAERRAEKLSQELEELKTKSRPDQANDAKASPPKPEDFKTVAEYADALTDYKVEKKLAQIKQEDADARQKEMADRAKQEFSRRIAKVMKDIPDYEEVVSRADVDVPPHIAQHIVESDAGPQLGYYLAKNPDEFNRLRALSPIRAIAELGKLEIKLEKPAEPEKKTDAAPLQQISKAPAPIEPLDGKSTPVTKDPAKMTFQELREYERQRAIARRR